MVEVRARPDACPHLRRSESSAGDFMRRWRWRRGERAWVVVLGGSIELRELVEGEEGWVSRERRERLSLVEEEEEEREGMSV